MVSAMVLLAFGTAAAQGDRAVLAGPIDAELLSRIEGQTADLAWEIERDEEPAPSDLDALGALADRARVVAWFERTGTGYSVSIADLRERRLLVQAVDAPPDEALAESALYETVAYLFRATLEALAMGATFGVEMPARAARVERVAVARPPPEARSTGSTRLDGAFGYAVAIDSRLAHGPIAGAGLWLGRFRIGLGGELGLPVEVEAALATIELSRHHAFASLGFDLAASDWSLVAEASAGAVIYRRTTTSAPDPLSPAPPATSVSPVISLSIRAIVWLVSAFGLSIELGADALLSPPIFEVEAGGNPVEVGRAWPIAPRAAASFVVRSGNF
jgi:hypothetical protein